MFRDEYPVFSKTLPPEIKKIEPSKNKSQFVGIGNRVSSF